MRELATVLILMAIVVFMLFVVAFMSDLIALHQDVSEAIHMAVAAGERG